MLALVVESWIWYAIAIGITACRFTSRVLLLKSPRHLQADDWIMLFAVATYTVLLVTINIVADASSNLLPPDYDMNLLTPEEIARRQYGSKMVLVVEQMQCATIWILKATLLIMYHRLTIAMRQNIAVKLLSFYTAFSFIVMEGLYLGVWCQPFHNYWAVPSPNVQCTAATNHLITNAVINISSDVFMLCIGISMFLRSRLPLRRKLVLYCVFGLGAFVILSAALNKYYSFTQPFGSSWTFWYVRESSTAFIVANIPYTWTLLRRVFNLKAFHIEECDRPVPFHSSRSAQGRHAARRSGSERGSGNHANLLKTNNSDSQNSQNSHCGRPSIFVDTRDIRKPSQASSGTSLDLEAARHFSTGFGPLPIPRHPDSASKRLSLRTDTFGPDSDLSSPVEMLGRALYSESKPIPGPISPVSPINQ